MERQTRDITGESVDGGAERELAKLIRKLRWIGQEDEASELESKLRFTRAGACVLAAPCDTD